MAKLLASGSEFEVEDVHQMAAEGLSPQEIAQLAGCSLWAILSAAPGCFEAPEVRKGKWFCAGCGKRLRNPENKRCRHCSYVLAPDRERARVMQAAGADSQEIADELGVSTSRVAWLLRSASSRGMHLQERPMRGSR